MSMRAQGTYLGNVLQQRLSTALVWLADAIAFLSRTVWPLVDVLIRIWFGKQALVLSVLISTDWAMAVSMAAGFPLMQMNRAQGNGGKHETVKWVWLFRMR